MTVLNDQPWEGSYEIQTSTETTQQISELWLPGMHTYLCQASITA